MTNHSFLSVLYLLLDIVGTIAAVVCGVLFIYSLGHWSAPIYLTATLISMAVAIFGYLKWQTPDNTNQ